MSEHAPVTPRSRDTWLVVSAYICTGLFLAIGALATSSWMWDSYLWIILTAGLGLLGLLLAYLSGSRKALVATSVIVSVATWVVINGLVVVEIFNGVPGAPGWGGPGI